MGWCGEGQASGHVLYWKFNCPGKDVKVTHGAEVVSIFQHRFQVREGKCSNSIFKRIGLAHFSP